MAPKGKPGKRPDLDCVILCLLRMHEDASGYQLRAFIEESTGYLYRAHLSQIYPALRRLNEADLVTCTVVARDGKPDLKLYRTTERGVRVSEEWLTEPFALERTRTSSDWFFLRIVFMGHLRPDIIVDYIDMGIEALEQQRLQHEENNLQAEMSFLTEQDPVVRGRYETIWSSELSFVLEEYDVRLKWLRLLRARLITAQ